LYDLQRALRDVMWERAGLVRDAEGLSGALAEVERIDRELDAVGVAGDPSLNTAWQDWLNLKSQALASRLIVTSALERRESRGAHWRRDFPGPEPAPHYTVRVGRTAAGPRVWREPVVFSRATPTGRALPATIEVGD
jgi:succinate dehydrogenase/fumarate reductase flavoprotein subunit